MSEIRSDVDRDIEARSTEWPDSRGRLNLTQAFLRYKPAGVIVALILLGATWTIATPFFLQTDNLLDITRQMSVLGLLAIGISLVLISGHIDLSIGSTYGLTTVVFALMVSEGHSILLTFVLCLLMGAFIGFVNGVLVAVFKLPSFIVTLGTLELLRGIALYVSDGLPISLFGLEAAGLGTFEYLGQGRLFGIWPMQFLILLVVAVVVGTFLQKTLIGLRLYSVGSSPRAAHLAGIPVVRMQVGAFMVSGLLAALGGLLAVAFLPTASPTSGAGLEFQVFAAAVLGGVSLFGGSGTMTGVVLGAGLLAVLANGLVLLGVSSAVQTSVAGVLVIVAIGVNVLIAQREHRG
jgi:ribose transport system permease protein